MVYLAMNDNGTCRTRYNNVLYTLYDKLDTVKVKKNGKVDVAGTPLWNARTGSLQKAYFLQPKGTRRVGKLKMGWLESVEEDLKSTGVRNWRRK